MSSRRTGVPDTVRRCFTCLTMRSRKVSSPFTLSRLLAFWSPMLVPRPPLSLMQTHWEIRSFPAGAVESVMFVQSATWSAGLMSVSGIMPEWLETRAS